MFSSNAFSTTIISILCVVVVKCNLAQDDFFLRSLDKRASQTESILSAERIVLGVATEAQINQLKQNLPVCSHLSNADVQTLVDAKLALYSASFTRKKRSLFNLKRRYEDEMYNDDNDDELYFDVKKRVLDSDIQKTIDLTAAFLAKVNQKSLAVLYQRAQEAVKSGADAEKQFISSIIESTSDCAKVKVARRLLDLEEYLAHDNSDKEY